MRSRGLKLYALEQSTRRRHFIRPTPNPGADNETETARREWDIHWSHPDRLGGQILHNSLRQLRGEYSDGLFPVA